MSLALACAVAVVSCKDEVKTPPPISLPNPADAGTGSPPAQDGSMDDDDAGAAPISETPDASSPMRWGGLQVSTTSKEQDLDLFGEAGHRFWVEVNDGQLAILNSTQAWGFQPFGEEDIYTPTGTKSASFADHVVVQDAKSGSVADYGKVEVALVGESTFRNWTLAAIPNLRFDSNEFEKGKRIGGFEHVRLNNSLVGSIFREGIAHRVFRELGYPALRSTFAFLGSNVWGEDIWVPMTLIEMYKKRFCKDNEALLGGDCTNMWEFPGDVGAPIGFGFPAPAGEDLPDNLCQVSECDNTRLEDLRKALARTPGGAGFQRALSELIDWDRFHRFQCLGWIMSTGDDALRNLNNNLIIEREDGRLIWAPYSVDISAGQKWYPHVPLLGVSSLARGCQTDPQCWMETVTACDDLIDAFDTLDPERFVDESVASLTDLGMMRDGDQERAEELRTWLVDRQESLRPELDLFRVLPDLAGVCPGELVACGDGGCGTVAECEERLCSPGMTMCEAWQLCGFTGDGCPVCDDPESPFYCTPVAVCVASVEDCTTAACAGQPGTVYCPAYQACVPPEDCALAGGDVAPDPILPPAPPPPAPPVVPPPGPMAGN